MIYTSKQLDYAKSKAPSKFEAKLQELKETMPEGFTLDLNGNLYDKTEGFAVGIQSTCLGEVLSTIDYMQTHTTWEDVSELYSRMFVGGWTDEATKIFYLDWVLIKNTKDEAIESAKRLNQLAIYDFENKEVIYL